MVNQVGNSGIEQFFDKAKDLLFEAKEGFNRVYDLAGRNCREMKEKNPQLFATLKKVALVGIALLSLLFRTIPTTIGFVLGAVFLKEIDDFIAVIDEKSSEMHPTAKKAAVVCLAGLFLIDPIFGGFATGLYCGKEISPLIKEGVDLGVKFFS